MDERRRMVSRAEGVDDGESISFMGMLEEGLYGVLRSACRLALIARIRSSAEFPGVLFVVGRCVGSVRREEDSREEGREDQFSCAVRDSMVWSSSLGSVVGGVLREVDSESGRAAVVVISGFNADCRDVVVNPLRVGY